MDVKIKSLSLTRKQIKNINGSFCDSSFSNMFS